MRVEFTEFYKAMFARQAERENYRVVFLACFVGLVAARVAWLGQSPQVLLH